MCVETVTTVAPLLKPHGIVCLPDGTIFIANAGTHMICTIAPGDKQLSIFVGGDWQAHRDGVGRDAAFSHPVSLAFRDGNLYVSDSGNQCIRCVTTDTSKLVFWPELQALTCVFSCLRGCEDGSWHALSARMQGWA